jgi:putative flippase GtrA
MIFDRILLKFIIVGLINTIAGSGLMFVMYNVFNVGYWISSASNYIFGSILSFFLNKYWTFNVQKWSLFIVVAFVLNIAIAYFIAYKMARVVIHLLLADYSEILRDNTAMLAGICLFTGLNYLGQRFIVFRK